MPAPTDPLKLLRASRSLLLIDWPSRDVPDSLARSGLDVVSADGPDTYNAYEPHGDTVRVLRVDGPPRQADIVYAHRPVDELDEIAQMARALGAHALWVQSGRDAQGQRDPRGCWLPPDQAARARGIARSAGLVYVQEPYIADAARARQSEAAVAD